MSLKTELERNSTEQKIHCIEQTRQTWFQLGDTITSPFKLWAQLGTVETLSETLEVIKVIGIREHQEVISKTISNESPGRD